MRGRRYRTDIRADVEETWNERQAPKAYFLTTWLSMRTDRWAEANTGDDNSNDDDQSND
jgi:hypothetical protein